MAYDEGLAQRVREVMEELPEARDAATSERRMFGGLCFMLGGNMAVGVVGDELMVRVGPAAYAAALAKRHAREMDFTGRPLRGMVYVAVAGFEDDADLESWVERGVAFAASLPAK